MKLGRGNKIVENNKNRRQVEKSKKKRSVEYSTVGCKVVVAFIHHLQNVQKGQCIMKRYNLHK